MKNPLASALGGLGRRRIGEWLRGVATSRRTRKWTPRVVALVLLYGLIGFFALPPLIHHVAVKQLHVLLSRPVSIQRVSLNPYTLRLEFDGLHIGARPAGATPPAGFVDVGRLVVEASWTSLLRFKPIIDEVYLQAPHLHIVRSAPQRFNFSDLVDKFGKPSSKPAGKPQLFSVSNIHVDHGRIDFDDRVTGQRHTIDQLRIGLPYLANLPSKTTIFVQPLLQARVDGDPLRIAGKVKPFAESRESDVAVKLNGLDLPQLLAYAPTVLPIKLTSGQLSTDLTVRFSLNAGKPSIDLNGSLELDRLAVTGRDARPLFAADAIRLVIAQLEPLRRIVHLGSLRIEHPVVNLSRGPGGALNLTRLVATDKSDPPPDGTPSTTASAHPTPAPAAVHEPASAPLDFRLHQLQLQGGSVRFEDHGTATPTTLGLSGVTLELENLTTLLDQPASFALQVQLDQGGSLNGRGTILLHNQTMAGELALNQLALPTFQPYLAGMLDGRLTSGSANAKVALSAAWSASAPALRLGDSSLTVENLRVVQGRDRRATVALGRLAVRIGQVDSARHEADIPSIRLDRLAVRARRARDGRLNLAQLLKSGAATASPAPPAARGTGGSGPAWKYRIGQISVGDSSIIATDRSAATPVRLAISHLQLRVRNIVQDLSRPWAVDLSARLQRRGKLVVSGTLAPKPLRARLKLQVTDFDVAALEPYVAAKLNAKLVSAWFGARGGLSLDGVRHAIRVGYTGNAGLWRVRMLDKATGDRFAGWHALRVSSIRASYGPDGTDADVGHIALSDFYGRVFLDRSGKLNLSRIVTHNEPAGRESLTRTGPGQTPAATPPSAATAPRPVSVATTTPSQPMKLRIGGIEFHGGQVDYSDEFIQPNFSAELTGIQGSVGAFGSTNAQPAQMQTQATLDGNGAVKIDGRINPLYTPAFLDVAATARDVLLTHFTAYATKYAGYPIEKGNLNVDLHYKLDQQQLTANNHIFISQLTFGQHVDSPTATHLPVLLAIALLKNAHGDIDVNVPVSGSLSDPHFSLGRVIWSAFFNLLKKAVTSPFRLLGSIFGGHGDSHPDYVAFRPGSSALSDQATQNLAALAKALANRPGLRLELIGRVDAATDTPALRRDTVDREVRQQRLKDLPDRGKAVDLDHIKLTPDQYDEYLTRAYSAADIKKPRNFLGFAKRLPAAKMKQLLLDNVTVTPADLTRLAQARAQAVKNLLDRRLDPKRITIAGIGATPPAAADKGPATRVDLKLRH